MSGWRHYKDSIAVMLPISLVTELETAEGMEEIGNHLTSLALGALHEEYPHTRLLAMEWTFAITPEQVEAWPLPHDCDDCRECKTMGIEALSHGPVIICLGTLHCMEPTNDTGEFN